MAKPAKYLLVEMLEDANDLVKGEYGLVLARRPGDGDPLLKAYRKAWPRSVPKHTTKVIGRADKLTGKRSAE